MCGEASGSEEGEGRKGKMRGGAEEGEEMGRKREKGKERGMHGKEDDGKIIFLFNITTELCNTKMGRLCLRTVLKVVG